MTKKSITFSVLGLLALVGIIVYMVVTPNAQEPVAPTSAPIMSDEGGGPMGEAPGDTGNAPGEDDLDGHVDDDQSDDLSTQISAASAFLTEYLRYEYTETAAARAARLSPLLAADSSTASRTPNVAMEDKWGYVGFNAHVNVTSIDVASVSAANDDTTQVKVDILTSYTAVYESAAQTQTRPNQQTFSVWIDFQPPYLVHSIEEPPAG
jgi:hypothetical protein